MDNYPDGVWNGDPNAPWNAEEAYCPICEEEIDPYWPFCPRCGTNVEEPLRKEGIWERPRT